MGRSPASGLADHDNSTQVAVYAKWPSKRPLLTPDMCNAVYLIVYSVTCNTTRESSRIGKILKFTLGLALTAVLVFPVSAAGIKVRDADTIVVEGKPVRLQGVDAPELNTRSGKDARRWMVSYLAGKSVECQLTGERSYDRWIGVCFAEGVDIGGAVISAGHALDCRRYSGGRYRHLETPAAKSRIRRAGYCR